MNKQQHQNRAQALNPGINQAEIDRKWRMLVREQEEMLRLQRISSESASHYYDSTENSYVENDYLEDYVV
jgi:hypothetical protein